MSDPDSARYCADLVREHQFSRYAATLFASAAQRRALLALYAYFGELLRVRDQVSQPMPGEIRLQWWVDALSGSEHGGAEGNPVLAELRLAMTQFGLPGAELASLADAWRFDLYDDPVETEAELDTQLVASHAPLYRLAARICGAPQPDGGIATKAGLADGLTQMLYALGRHAARGQVLLPQELMALNGASRMELLAGTPDEGLRRVLAYLAQRARLQLDDLHRDLEGAPRTARIAVLPLASARMVLASLQEPSVDPLRPPVLSRLSVLWATWRAARDIRRL